jgi:prefoldin subunit 5
MEVKPDIEEATRAIRNHQQELKKEMRELQRALRDEEIQIQKNHIQKKKARVLWQPEADI